MKFKTSLILYAFMSSPTLWAKSPDCFLKLVELIQHKSSLVFDPVSYSSESEHLWEQFDAMIETAQAGNEIKKADVENFFIDLALKLKKNGNSVFVDVEKRELQVYADSKTALGQSIALLQSINPNLNFVFRISDAVEKGSLQSGVTVVDNTVFLIADTLMSFGLDLNGKKVLYTDESSHLSQMISEVLAQNTTLKQWSSTVVPGGSLKFGKSSFAKLLFQAAHVEKIVEAIQKIDPELRYELGLELRHWVNSTSTQWQSFAKPLSQLQEFLVRSLDEKTEINVRTYGPNNFDLEIQFFEKIESKNQTRYKSKIRYLAAFRGEKVKHGFYTSDSKQLEYLGLDSSKNAKLRDLSMAYLLDFQFSQPTENSKAKVLQFVKELFLSSSNLVVETDQTLKPVFKELFKITESPKDIGQFVDQTATAAQQLKNAILELSQKARSSD